MKYLRLKNGNTLPFETIEFTNAWIIGLREDMATLDEIRNFFGREIVDEVDILDENKTFISSKYINAKYANLYLESRLVTDYEDVVVAEERREPALDENGDTLRDPQTDEILYNVYPQEVKQIARESYINMVFVILERPDVNDEVESLKEKVGIVNPNNLNLQEYKGYYKKELGKLCTQNIEAGTDITVENDTETVHFSFSTVDQVNILNLFINAMITKFQYPLPYHFDNGYCRLFDPKDIMKIYATMQLHIAFHTTYCNTLNRKVDEAQSLNAIKTIVYGMELEGEDLKRLNDMINAAKLLINVAQSEYFGAVPTEESPVKEEGDTDEAETETPS